MDDQVAESINASKLLSLGLGEKLAKMHIFPYLDIFYRDPRSSLNANLFLHQVMQVHLLNLGITTIQELESILVNFWNLQMILRPLNNQISNESVLI